MDAAEDEPQPTSPRSRPARRPAGRAWQPEVSDEVGAVLRRLAANPWLLPGRDDAAIGAVRRNRGAVRDAFARLGWVVVEERDLVRLRKSPPPRRRAWQATAPPPQVCSWFFLLVAAAEGMPPRCGIGQLARAARTAAAEAGLPATGDIRERRAIHAAFGLLGERGLVTAIDGDVGDFLDSDDAPVLLAVHHTRLLHVIANPGDLELLEDPARWLDRVEAEEDPARRMRRRLIDDTAVYAGDLDEAEADWLSRRVRGDDGGPLAEQFGLHLERRAEGAAFVVPDDAFRRARDLGDVGFPRPGTVAAAAVLLFGHAADSPLDPGPGPGWRGLHESTIRAVLADAAPDQPGWSADLVLDPAALAEHVTRLLDQVGLARRDDTSSDTVWWFSPMTARWTAQQPPPAKQTPRPAPAAQRYRGLPDELDLFGTDDEPEDPAP